MRIGAWGREERGGGRGRGGEGKGRGLVPPHMTCLHDAPVWPILIFRVADMVFCCGRYRLAVADMVVADMVCGDMVAPL